MPDRAEQERAFHRAGLPSFIGQRTATGDIWTRAVPVLALVFGGELLGAVDLDVAWWANVLLVLAGVAILLASLALVNRLRGRPPLARPETVGGLELGAFVIVPALLPLALNQQWVSAVVTAAGNLVLLAFLYGAIGYGLVSILRWAIRRLIGQLATSLSLLVRAISLLLLFNVVLFISTEMWQTFADLEFWRVAGVAGLLLVVGTAFGLVRMPREVGALEAEVQRDVGGPPLEPRQRANVALVLFVSQSLQVLTVTLAVWAFFIAFGLLTISDELIATWIGHAPHVYALGITTELLQVAGAIAALSGLYYAIAVQTDATYREEFLTEITDEMRGSFVARVAYLRATA
ncbi:MAG: hypothetical protein ACJ762_01170 [Solirubrobacteraceae bacterium]